MSERIKIELSVFNVLEIGLNAQIDYENTEYLWFDKVFNFYSSLEVISEPRQTLSKSHSSSPVTKRSFT